MAKSKSSGERKVHPEKMDATQKHWRSRIKRHVAAHPNDTQASSALARGIHPVRKTPRKHTWSSSITRRYAHMLRQVGENGNDALIVVRMSDVRRDTDDTDDTDGRSFQKA